MEPKSVIINNDLVFYNTEESPLDVVRLGVFQSHKRAYGDTVYFELCELHYPHPQAPEYAKIQMLKWMEVAPNFGTKALFDRVIEEGKALQKICELKD